MCVSEGGGVDLTHPLIIAFHEYLGKPPLIFNSSFLDHEVFHVYMCQKIDAFAYRVQFDGYESWEVFVGNVQRVTRYCHRQDATWNVGV